MKWPGERKKLHLIDDMTPSNLFSPSFDPATDESTKEIPEGVQYGGFYWYYCDSPDKPRVVATSRDIAL